MEKDDGQCSEHDQGEKRGKKFGPIVAEKEKRTGKRKTRPGKGREGNGRQKKPG